MCCKLCGANYALRSIATVWVAIDWIGIDWIGTIRLDRFDWNDSIARGGCNRAAATGCDEARRGGDGRHRPQKPALTPRWLREVRTPKCKHCLGKNHRTGHICSRRCRIGAALGLLPFAAVCCSRLSLGVARWCLLPFVADCCSLRLHAAT